MGFNAATAVDPLDWDFTTYKGGKKGTIPEPSDTAITEFQKELQRAMAEVTDMFKGMDPKNIKPEQMAAAMEALDKVDMAKVNGQIKTAVAKLCQDNPNKAQLDLLSYRVLNAFVQWLQSELSPEGRSAGMSNAQATRPGA